MSSAQEPITTLADYIAGINKIAAPNEDNRYIYRGQKNETWQIQSWALRRLQKEPLEHPQLFPYLFRGYIHQISEKRRPKAMNKETLSENYFQRANVRASLGKYEKAIADYDTALDLNPQRAAAYINRGIVKNYLRRYEAAIADLGQALNLDPQNAIAYYNRGFTKDRLPGQHEEARADFQRALELATEQGNEELVQLAQEDLNKLPADNSHEDQK